MCECMCVCGAKGCSLLSHTLCDVCVCVCVCVYVHMHAFLSGLFGHHFLITDHMPRVQPQWVLESGLFPCLQVSLDINFGIYAGFFWTSISHNPPHATRATAVGVRIRSLSIHASLF